MVLLKSGQHTTISKATDIKPMPVEAGPKPRGISIPSEDIDPHVISCEAEKLKNRNSIALLMAPAASIQQKRKERPPHLAALLCEPKRADSLSDPETDASTRVMTPTTPADEYSSGCIFCDTCGERISIKDDAGFTVKYWEAHRNTCRVDQLAPEPPNFNFKTTVEASHHHGHQPQGTERIRRRAKRTEEERIDYLRSDPCVARFEAYRVLCASCDRWIRLRFNSTYCSVPWDAHRNRCLAKRAAKNFTSTFNDRRSPMFSADPSVEQSSRESSPVRSPKRLLALASSSPLPPPPSASESPRMTVSQSPPLSRSGVINASPTVMAAETFTSVIRVKDYPSSNHDSRRHKADQRAAALRADAMLGAVEPDRVFCRLCEKWVRLRQDSTYCAYPWRQHRSKCLLRHQKISDRVAAITELRARRDAALVDELKVDDWDSQGFGEGDSEDGDKADCARGWRAERRPAQANAAATPARLQPRKLKLEVEEPPRHGRAGSIASSELEDDDAICDRMDVDMPAPRRRLADLDSPAGRLDFASRSIRHLFRTTYTRSDELTIAALVVYLNVAIPPDKHEDFDTAEVTKMMRVLHGRGMVVFEGDVICMPN